MGTTRRVWTLARIFATPPFLLTAVVAAFAAIAAAVVLWIVGGLLVLLLALPGALLIGLGIGFYYLGKTVADAGTAVCVDARHALEFLEDESSFERKE